MAYDYYGSAILAANKALGGGIKAFNAAKSYSMPLANRAKALAKAVASAPNVSRNALIGAGIGGLGGVSYNAVFDDRSDWRSMTRAGIKGGIMGALGGAGYSYGRSAWNNVGGMAGVKAAGRSGWGGVKAVYGSAKSGWQNMVTEARMRNTPSYRMRNRMLTAGHPFSMGPSSL